MDEIKYKKRTPRSPDSIRQICEDFEIFMCYQNVPIVSGFPQNLRWKILQNKSVTYVKPQNKYPDRNTYSRDEPNKRYDNDQPNNRYIPNRLRRTDSMHEFRGAFEYNRPQNGNRYPYQEQQKRNNMENHRNDFHSEATNHRSKMPSNESAYSSRTTLSFSDPLLETRRSVEKAEINSVTKEKSPESDQPLIEKRPKESSKTCSSSSIDSDDEKLVQMILKSLKKIKSVRDKKSKKSSSYRRSPSCSSSDSKSDDVKGSKELEYAEKRSSRKKEYYSESDSESDDGGKRGHHKEYSRKKHHNRGDSDEMKKSRNKRRDSPRSEREKLRNGYDSKEKLIEKKSSKYEVRNGYSSNDDDHSYSNDRGTRKEKRSSRCY